MAMGAWPISERRQEIGILKAVGLVKDQIKLNFSVEVTLMGIISWILGIFLSIPISIWTGNYFGKIFLKTNLVNTLSISGILLWFFLSTGISFVSGIIPVNKALATSISEVLVYE